MKHGSYDPSTDWSHLGLKDDAEIAKRLQAEEFNPEVNFIKESDIYDTGAVKEFVEPMYEKVKSESFSRLGELEKKANELSKKESELQNKNKQIFDILEREKRELREIDELKLSQKNLQRRLDNEMIRPRVSEPYVVYKYLYDWGLGLVPDYYTYLQRKRYQDLLDKLIKDDIRLSVPKYIIEDKIKELIRALSKESDVSTPKQTAPRKKSSAIKRKKSSGTKRKKSNKPVKKPSRTIKKTSKSTKKTGKK